MMMKKTTLTLAISLLFSFTAGANAASLSATVTENGDSLLRNAVVYAIPDAGLSTAEKNAHKKIIDQIDKEFVPSVSVIQTGTSIEFPNLDKIRHHVYSFSAAKSFEIPLYKGTPANPVKFDQPGVVKLGCNIHDWMAANVFITETPYFGISDKQGKVALKNLPAGNYKVYVWHPQQNANTKSTVQQVSVNDAGTQPVKFVVARKKQWIPFRAPSSAASGY